MLLLEMSLCMFVNCRRYLHNPNFIDFKTKRYFSCNPFTFKEKFATDVFFLYAIRHILSINWTHNSSVAVAIYASDKCYIAFNFVLTIWSRQRRSMCEDALCALCAIATVVNGMVTNLINFKSHRHTHSLHLTATVCLCAT